MVVDGDVEGAFGQVDWTVHQELLFAAHALGVDGDSETPWCLTACREAKGEFGVNGGSRLDVESSPRIDLDSQSGGGGPGEPPGAFDDQAFEIRRQGWVEGSQLSRFTTQPDGIGSIPTVDGGPASREVAKVDQCAPGDRRKFVISATEFNSALDLSGVDDFVDPGRSRNRDAVIGVGEIVQVGADRGFGFISNAVQQTFGSALQLNQRAGIWNRADDLPRVAEHIRIKTIQNIHVGRKRALVWIELSGQDADGFALLDRDDTCIEGERPPVGSEADRFKPLHCDTAADVTVE